MTLTHHGTVKPFTVGDVFIRHREVMRELLGNHRVSTRAKEDYFATRAPSRREIPAEVLPHRSNDFFLRPLGRFQDSFATTEREEFFDCVSDEEEGLLGSHGALQVVQEQVGFTSIKKCDNMRTYQGTAPAHESLTASGDDDDGIIKAVSEPCTRATTETYGSSGSPTISKMVQDDDDTLATQLASISKWDVGGNSQAEPQLSKRIENVVGGFSNIDKVDDGSEGDPGTSEINRNRLDPNEGAAVIRSPTPISIKDLCTDSQSESGFSERCTNLLVANEDSAFHPRSTSISRDEADGNDSQTAQGLFESHESLLGSKEAGALGIQSPSAISILKVDPDSQAEPELAKMDENLLDPDGEDDVLSTHSPSAIDDSQAEPGLFEKHESLQGPNDDGALRIQSPSATSIQTADADSQVEPGLSEGHDSLLGPEEVGALIIQSPSATSTHTVDADSQAQLGLSEGHDSLLGPEEVGALSIQSPSATSSIHIADADSQAEPGLSEDHDSLLGPEEVGARSIQSASAISIHGAGADLQAETELLERHDSFLGPEEVGALSIRSPSGASSIHTADVDSQAEPGLSERHDNLYVPDKGAPLGIQSPTVVSIHKVDGDLQAEPGFSETHERLHAPHQDNAEPATNSKEKRERDSQADSELSEIHGSLLGRKSNTFHGSDEGCDGNTRSTDRFIAGSKASEAQDDGDMKFNIQEGMESLCVQKRGRAEKEVQEAAEEPLSPPKPIRETSIALPDKFNACVDMWTEINRPPASGEQDFCDEDQRPGLSPLTIFSDDHTEFGSQEPIRAQHFSAAAGDTSETPAVEKASQLRFKGRPKDSPHLIPSPRSISSGYMLFTFSEPILRTTERARSRQPSSHDGPSTPHRIPSTASRSSVSDPLKGFPGSISPALSPPRVKSRNHMRRTNTRVVRKFW